MPDEQPSHAELFTVRVWAEPVGEGRVEFRYQAQHVLTGERQSFRDRDRLMRFLQAQHTLPSPRTEAGR